MAGVLVSASTPAIVFLMTTPTISTNDRILVLNAIDEFLDFINTEAKIPEGYTYYADEPGKRYTRIVMNANGSRSVHCFIDNAKGTLLKSAGWKAPAKGPRGNIVTDLDGVTARFDWSGHYLYIR